MSLSTSVRGRETREIESFNTLLARIQLALAKAPSDIESTLFRAVGAEGFDSITIPSFITKGVLEPLTLLHAGEIGVEEAKLMMERNFSAIIATGTLASSANLGSDFLDYGMGQVFADALRPIITKLISDEVYDELENIYATNSLSPTMFLRPAVVETATDFDIIREMIDSGFKRTSISTVIKLKRSMTVERNWKEYNNILHQVFEVQKNVYIAQITVYENELNDLEKKFETALRAVIVVQNDVEISSITDDIKEIESENKSILKEIKELQKPIKQENI